MNDYDRENLQFLLNASPDVIRDWYDTVDPEDIEYATELMTLYSEELRIKSIFHKVHDTDLAAGTPDADKYLRRFTMGKTL